MKRLSIFLAYTLASTYAVARADFTYQETTQITGGSIVSMLKLAGSFSKQARQAGEPIVSTVTIKGNRMMHANKDRTEIIDLDAGTITVIDHVKKQYTTMTFEQMRKEMEAAMAKAKAQQSKQRQEPASNEAENVDLRFSVKVRGTGATKDVAGLNTNESIMTITLEATDQKSGQAGTFAITNDMYLAPEIPGYGEVREFYKRYATRMGVVLTGAVNSQILAMMQQPAAGKGMADMVEEMSKLKGIPVLQIMRVGTAMDGTPLPAASEAPLPTGPPPPTAGGVAKAAIISSLPFGGFGRKKKQEEAPPTDSSAVPAAAVLMETNIQLTSFSRASVDGSQFSIPAAYKQVEARQMD